MPRVRVTSKLVQNARKDIYPPSQCNKKKRHVYIYAECSIQIQDKEANMLFNCAKEKSTVAKLPPLGISKGELGTKPVTWSSLYKRQNRTTNQARFTRHNDPTSHFSFIVATFFSKPHHEVEGTSSGLIR
jgi:hypothetical protein